jgi:tetratricopeptide (TPR) repeat protein
MNSSTPSFLTILKLLIEAFHLDHEAPDISPSGRLQAALSGRRIDLRDSSYHELVRAFADALMRSNVLPSLTTAMTRPVSASQLLTQYVGEPFLAELGAAEGINRLVFCLVRGARNHEAFVNEARAQAAAQNLDPAFGLQPLVRFASHHLAFQLGAMVHAHVLDVALLEPSSAELSWVFEFPTKSPHEHSKGTPLSRRGREAGLTLGQIKNGSPDRQHHGLDPKTIENAWNGGPDHVSIDTMRALLKFFGCDDPQELARWRRWFGLRHLAQRMVAVRGWDWNWIGGLVATTLAHAREVADALAQSSLKEDERDTVAVAAFADGWRLPVARWYFAERSKYYASSGFDVDFEAIGHRSEHLRLQACLQLASKGPAVERERLESGRTALAARTEAVHIIAIQQGRTPPIADSSAALLQALILAKQREDWQGMEHAARGLIDSGHATAELQHMLFQALWMQRRWDEGMAALDAARDLGLPNLQYQLRAAELLMDRSSQHEDATGFERALQALEQLKIPEQEYYRLALIGDCHFALGNWSEALASFQAAARAKPDFGEAYAMGSIAARKRGTVGDTATANDLERKAVRRGAEGLLRLLMLRDNAGHLGRSGNAPVACWHRISN